MDKIDHRIQFSGIVLFTGLVLCACSKRIGAADPAQLPPPGLERQNATRILFLTFKILKDSAAAAGARIQLVDSRKVGGQLKSRIKRPELVKTNDLICEFLDTKQTVLAAEVLEDPLTASVEYPDDDGAFKRAFPARREADLFLRVQYNPLISSLTIKKMMPGGAALLIAEFPIR